MPDREKVIKGIECHRKKVQTTNSISCLECPYSEPNPIREWCMSGLIDDICALLKEQEELIKAMKRDLDLVRSCKVCGNWTKCTPDAPPESEEFKMWRDCGGSCKLNWTWRGI